MSEKDMKALVLFEQEFAPDIFGICDNYRQLGKATTKKAIGEWLEISGEPATLASAITKLVVRKCKSL